MKMKIQIINNLKIIIKINNLKIMIIKINKKKIMIIKVNKKKIMKIQIKIMNNSWKKIIILMSICFTLTQLIIIRKKSSLMIIFK